MSSPAGVFAVTIALLWALKTGRLSRIAYTLQTGK